MIDFITKLFCKHEFKEIEHRRFADCTLVAYFCPKCGKIVRKLL